MLKFLPLPKPNPMPTELFQFSHRIFLCRWQWRGSSTRYENSWIEFQTHRAGIMARAETSNNGNRVSDFLT
jgi:hypothetical protein